MLRCIMILLGGMLLYFTVPMLYTLATAGSFLAAAMYAAPLLCFAACGLLLIRLARL